MAKKAVKKSRAKNSKRVGLKPYEIYWFEGQDPVVEKVLDAVDKVGVKPKALSTDSGVAASTLGNWRSKKTKRPQFATLNATLMAIDKEFAIVNRK